MVEVNKRQTFTGHKDAVYALARGSSSSAFYSAGADGMVVEWNLEQPDEGRLFARFQHSIYALHYLAEPRQLVVGHNFDGIHVLDSDGQQEVAAVPLGKAALFDIQSYEDLLFVAQGDGVVSVVNMNNWQVFQRLKASEKSARTLAINPIRAELAVGYSDHSIRVFGLDSYALKQEWVAHNNSVFTLSYSPDFESLVSGSRDAQVKIWRCGTPYELQESIMAHLYAINHLQFSPDSKHFVTCSMDKSIKVWSFEDRKLLKVIDKARHAGHGTSVNKLLWTPFDDQLISASDDRTISAWKLFFKLT